MDGDDRATSSEEMPITLRKLIKIPEMLFVLSCAMVPLISATYLDISLSPHATSNVSFNYRKPDNLGAVTFISHRKEQKVLRSKYVDIMFNSNYLLVGGGIVYMAKYGQNGPQLT